MYSTVLYFGFGGDVLPRAGPGRLAAPAVAWLLSCRIAAGRAKDRETKL